MLASEEEESSCAHNGNGGAHSGGGGMGAWGEDVAAPTNKEEKEAEEEEDDEEAEEDDSPSWLVGGSTRLRPRAGARPTRCGSGYCCTRSALRTVLGAGIETPASLRIVATLSGRSSCLSRVSCADA